MPRLPCPHSTSPWLSSPSPRLTLPQEFAVKADSGCGSTIGPAIAANTGIRTADVGAPQLSMHSAREMMCAEDVGHSLAVLQAALEHYGTVATAVDLDVDMPFCAVCAPTAGWPA